MVVHRGMWWASVHATHTRQRDHVQFEIMPDRGVGPPPPVEELVAVRVGDRLSPTEVPFGDDLDAIEADGEAEGDASPEAGGEAGPAGGLAAPHARGRGTACVLLRCISIITKIMHGAKHARIRLSGIPFTISI